MASLLRFPRPRSFLHLIPLRTATEFIAFTLAINKLTGLYGILALFTGYHLNPLQFSHYVYSLLVLALIGYLSPAIRSRRGVGEEGAGEVVKVMALAWVYVADTVINSVYTALFGLGWFVLLAQHLNESIPMGDGHAPGGGMMNDTAGFTSPEHPGVSKVDVIATPAPGGLTGQAAVAYGSQTGSLGGAVFQKESLMSLVILGLLWMLRFYFCLIVLSYARSTLRAHVAATSATASNPYPETTDPTMAENPFRPGTAEGAGWKGKAGRFMLRFPTARYWLGKDDREEEWARQASSRFEGARGLKIKVPAESGLGERERRARSGTGPPPPVAVGGKKVPQ